MKFEEKQIQLFKSIAKFVVLGGIFLWLLQEIINLPYGGDGFVTGGFAVFILIADIVAMLAMLAFVGKMFLEKYATILDSVFQIGLLIYVFFTAFAQIFRAFPNYAAIIVMSIITLALIVGLVFDTIKKRGLQFFDKFLLSICILMLGVFDLVVNLYIRVGGMTFLPTNMEFFMLLFTVVLVTLERYTDLDEKIHQVMNLLLWNLAFFGLAIGATTWTGVIGIIADICVAAGAVVYVVMTYFKLKTLYGTETTIETAK
jgi:hypothetical protein